MEGGFEIGKEIEEMMNPAGDDDKSDNSSGGPISEVSSDGDNPENYDLWDVMLIKAASEKSLSQAYQQNFLFRWDKATQRLQNSLRDNALLPLKPTSIHDADVYTDLAKGIRLPPWHCMFKGCCAVDVDPDASCSHERKL